MEMVVLKKTTSRNTDHLVKQFCDSNSVCVLLRHHLSDLEKERRLAVQECERFEREFQIHREALLDQDDAEMLGHDRVVRDWTLTN